MRAKRRVKVSLVKTTPARVVSDYRRLVKSWWQGISPQPVVVKLNLSWTKFYPACSSPPWQLEGVIQGLLDLGFKPEEIIPVENRTVVTDVVQGAKNHFWDKVAKNYNVRIHFLTKEKYVKYQPKGKLLVLNKIFPQGIFLPKILFNKPLISLCTLKTHVFTQTTGAIKNYFGMLDTRRHWAHRFIHEAIVDLLKIQKEIHPRILALMDGTVIGYGAGPRAMRWRLGELILASEDEVALDSLASHLLGFSPLKIKYLKLARREKLGENRLAKITTGGKIPSFHLSQDDTFASRGQKLIYHFFPWWLEKLLLQTFLVPWSYLASRLYYDGYWYNLKGRSQIKRFLKTAWGQLFLSYGKDKKI